MKKPKPSDFKTESRALGYMKRLKEYNYSLYLKACNRGQGKRWLEKYSHKLNP